MSPTKSPIKAFIRGLYGPEVSIDLDLLPESIDDSYSANFHTQSFQGRSSPVIGYGDGGPREVSFSLQIHDDLISQNGSDIVDIVNQLKSLSYPEYERKVIPPKIYLRMGDMVSIVGVCTNVGVSWEKPYGETTKGRIAYKKAEVSLSFQEVIQIPQSASGVVEGNQSGDSI